MNVAVIAIELEEREKEKVTQKHRISQFVFNLWSPCFSSKRDKTWGGPHFLSVSIPKLAHCLAVLNCPIHVPRHLQLHSQMHTGALWCQSPRPLLGGTCSSPHPDAAAPSLPVVGRGSSVECGCGLTCIWQHNSRTWGEQTSLQQ